MSVHDDNKNLIPGMLKELETTIQHVNESPLAQQSAELVMALNLLHAVAENLAARVDALEAKSEDKGNNPPTQPRGITRGQAEAMRDR